MNKPHAYAVTTKANRILILVLKPHETFEDWWIGLVNQGGDILFAQPIPIPVIKEASA